MNEQRIYKRGRLQPKDFPKEKRQSEISRIIEALDSGKRLIIISGGRQAGKSSLGLFVTSEHCNEIDKTKVWIDLQGISDYQDFLMEFSDRLLDKLLDEDTPCEKLEAILLKKVGSLSNGLLLGLDETAKLVSEGSDIGKPESRKQISNFLLNVKEACPASSFIFAGTPEHISQIQDITASLFTEEEIENINLRPIPQEERPYMTISDSVEAA